MRRRLLVPAIGLALACTGCVSDDGAGDGDEGLPVDVPIDWAELALAYGEEHDHTDVAQHTGLSTPNFDVVGHDALLSPSTGITNGGHFCGDAQATTDGRRIAAVESRVVGGFVFSDVTDPAAPKLLGELVLPSSRVYDLAVVPDGRHVVLVTTEQVGLPVQPPALAHPVPRVLWRDACGRERPVATSGVAAEDPVPRPSSTLLVSIEDPAMPRIIDQRPLPTAGHSAFATIIDDRTLVLITGTAALGNRYHGFYEVVDTPLGAKLQFLSSYLMQGPPEAGPGRVVEGHDGWIGVHPVTGQTLAYLAGGREFHIVDLTDLTRPRLVGRWTDWSPQREGISGALHSAYAMPALWGDKHYTLVGPEFGEHPVEHPSGIVWVLDTTDPASPHEVAAWTLPHDAEWAGTYMFSNHYFTVQGRTMFIAMYHGGVWAVDLSVVGSDDFVLLTSVGVFLPDRVSPVPPETIIRWTPTVEDVIAFDDGSIVLFDETSGLYVVRFDAAMAVPRPQPWPIEPIG